MKTMVAPIYRFLIALRLLYLHPSLAKTIRCTNTTSLHAALVSVEPGDEILLAPGTYYDEDGISDKDVIYTKLPWETLERAEDKDACERFCKALAKKENQLI